MAHRSLGTVHRHDHICFIPNKQICKYPNDFFSHWVLISLVQVLLLEAGIEEPKVAEVPAFAPLLQRSNIDWQYMTQPEKHACLAQPNGQCYWARGKVMGRYHCSNRLRLKLRN